MKQQQSGIDKKRKIIVLLIIFLLAVFLRITGNVVSEKVFFRRPFLYFGEDSISIIDPQTEREIKRIKDIILYEPNCISALDNGHLVVSSQLSIPSIIDPDRGELIKTIRKEGLYGYARITVFDNGYLAILTPWDSIFIIDPDSERLIKKIEDIGLSKPSEPTDITVLATGVLVVTDYGDNSLLLIDDYRRPKPFLKRIKDGLKLQKPYWAETLPSGHLVVANSGDKSISVINSDTWEEIKRIREVGLDTGGIAVLNDGNLAILNRRDYSISIINPNTGKELKKIQDLGLDKAVDITALSNGHLAVVNFGDRYHRDIIRSDSIWYDGTARALLDGKGLASLDKNTLSIDYKMFHPWFDIKEIDKRYFAHNAIMPFYPLFLAFCYYLGGINTLSYFIPQLILGSLTCLILYLLAMEIFDNQKVAALAGFAVACYPDLIFWTYKVHPETLFIFLLGLGFFLLLRGNNRESPLLIFISAIVFGLAALTRITFIYFIPLLFLWELLFFKKRGRRNPSVGLIMLLLMLLVLLPWCARNLLVFGKFTPFTLEIYAFFPSRNDEGFGKAEQYLLMNQAVLFKIIAFIKDHPKEYLQSLLGRLMVFWGPYTTQMRTLAKLYKGLTWLFIFPAAFFGIFVSRKYWTRSGVITAFIFYHSLLHAGSSIGYGLIYRYPIQPFLCIFSAYSFWMIYRKAKPGYA